MLLQSRRRRAATIVETAVVISICLLFMFGIFEYGRFLMHLHIVENAAREGARYAAAHTNDGTDATVKARVDEKMAGIQNQFASGSYKVTVSGLVLRPQSGQTAGDPLTSWTNASPTDGISVEVEGDYKPVLPSFLQMPTSIKIKSRSVMYSEGN